MEVRCSICGELHDSTILCSGCSYKQERDPRIPPGINKRGYDLDDWQYFRLVELILAGEKLNEYEYKFLHIQPGTMLTREQADDMYHKRVKHIQAKAKQREEDDRRAESKEANRRKYRLF